MRIIWIIIGVLSGFFSVMSWFGVLVTKQENYSKGIELVCTALATLNVVFVINMLFYFIYRG